MAGRAPRKGRWSRPRPGTGSSGPSSWPRRPAPVRRLAGDVPPAQEGCGRRARACDPPAPARPGESSIPPGCSPGPGARPPAAPRDRGGDARLRLLHIVEGTGLVLGRRLGGLLDDRRHGLPGPLRIIRDRPPRSPDQGRRADRQSRLRRLSRRQLAPGTSLTPRSARSGGGLRNESSTGQETVVSGFLVDDGCSSRRSKENRWQPPGGCEGPPGRRGPSPVAMCGPSRPHGGSRDGRVRGRSGRRGRIAGSACRPRTDGFDVRTLLSS